MRDTSLGTAPSDEDLARAALRHPPAFNTLYARYIVRVYRYVYARVGHKQDAEDITAQTFLTAYTHLDHFRHEGSFAAWLFSIARRRTIDCLRAYKPDLSWETTAEPISREPPPEDMIDHHLEVERLVNRLRSLTDDQSEVIRLRIFAGLSILETAQAMRRSEAAIKMLLHRALRQLREHMEIEEKP